MYAAAEYSRLTSDWAPSSSSSDAEIVTSQRVLRNRSRQLIRDNEYAKNLQRVIVTNVIGTGVGMQSVIKNSWDNLHVQYNDKVQEAWHDWWKDAEQVHTAGLMNGPDIERYLMGNIFESGEGLTRFVQQPFGRSKIPLALELVESDRLMDQWTQRTLPGGAVVRMGVEMDQWHRPTGYWLWPVHPGDWQFATFSPSAFIRVPAAELCHLYVIDRWPQSRGVPWMAAAMRRLNDMGGYEHAEIVAARGAAAIMGFVTSPEPPSPDDIENGKRVDDMEPGQIRHLLPGESFTGFNPARANAAIEPFLRIMLRAACASIGVSYEAGSRDVSNTNYSSIRAAELQDRDLYRVIQHWYIGRFRMRLHREWMTAAVLAGVLKIDDFFSNEQKYLKAYFKPRGWSWIDPVKEVGAYVTAVRSGFMTVTDVIEQTAGGKDAHVMFNHRRAELDEMAELDLVFDTDPAQVNQKGIAQLNTAPEEEVDKPAQPGLDAEQGDDQDDDDDKPDNDELTPAQKAAAKAAKTAKSGGK